MLCVCRQPRVAGWTTNQVVGLAWTPVSGPTLVPVRAGVLDLGADELYRSARCDAGRTTSTGVRPPTGVHARPKTWSVVHPMRVDHVPLIEDMMIIDIVPRAQILVPDVARYFEGLAQGAISINTLGFVQHSPPQGSIESAISDIFCGCPQSASYGEGDVERGDEALAPPLPPWVSSFRIMLSTEIVRFDCRPPSRAAFQDITIQPPTSSGHIPSPPLVFYEVDHFISLPEVCSLWKKVLCGLDLSLTHSRTRRRRAYSSRFRVFVTCLFKSVS
ncbi:hypothetical protein AAWM_04706 [Aspergillus awamori]|uniref:Uncharacterized protein n=1 Tax=Aspergillus awamori TaxID=105351 RepID=A0A401KRE0_ASPAW|nr:hypothetical protein AAWM_04706 [Aspergillus awamori]